MARKKKNKDTSVVCYKYWIKPVSKELPKEVYDEAYKMNCFWNRLVNLSERNRQVYQQILLEDENIAKIKEEYETKLNEVNNVYAEIKKARVRFRSKNSPLLEQYKQEYKRLKDELTSISNQLKQIKQHVKERKQKEIQEATNQFMQDIDKEWKRTYKEELYWANAGIVKDNFMTSWKQGLKKGEFPKYHKFTGDIRFAFQFPGGRDTRSLFGDSSKILSIEQMKVETTATSKRQIEKQQKRAILHARIGGVSVPFHINIHRPIPSGLLKTATIKCTKQGTHREWSISLTIEQQAKKFDTVIKKTASLDVGWRLIDSSIRIAVLISDNERRDIYLPYKVVSSMQYAKILQSQRDKLFEEIKQKIAETMPSDIPAELKVNWDKARQPRLIKIMRYYKEIGHFMYEDLSRWHKEDMRYYNECVGLRQRAIRHRRDFCYCTANKIFDKYDRVIIEALDLSVLALRERKNGDVTELREEARFNRFITALSEFIGALKHIANKKGKVVEERDPAYTTMMCHICGEIVQTKNRAKLVWHCAGCGSSWDQDYNAANNLLSQGKVLSETMP